MHKQHHLASSLVFAFALLPCLVAAQAPDPYNSATLAFAQHRYSEAANLFGKAADTLHPDAHLLQGKSFININDFPHAEQALRQQLILRTDAPTLYLLAYVLFREDRPRESLQIMNRATALATPLANDLKIAGLDYVLLNDNAQAIHWLTRATEADPHDPEILYDLGRAHMTTGNFNAAESLFQRALSLRPGNVKTLNNLGLCYEAENRPQQALALYQQAVDAQQNSSTPSEQPLLNLGALLITQNKGDEALPLLQQCVSLQPRSSRCHEELAHAYAQTKQDTLARQHMEAAVQLDSTNARLHYQLGQLYRHAGMKLEADHELARSAALYGTHSSQPNQ